MNIYWQIAIGLVILYYGYILWVLKFKKKSDSKKIAKNIDYNKINTNLVNNSPKKQSELEAILSQVEEVENNSKLLDAFKSGSEGDTSKSLTRKKNERLKIIRDEGDVDPSENDTD